MCICPRNCSEETSVSVFCGAVFDFMNQRRQYIFYILSFCVLINILLYVHISYSVDTSQISSTQSKLSHQENHRTNENLTNFLQDRLKKNKGLKSVITSDRDFDRMEEKMNKIVKAERAKVQSNKTIPFLTIFTTWKPSQKLYLCHNNTVYNWLMLHPLIIPVLFTNDFELAGRVMQKGWNVLPVPKFTIGLPVLKYMYIDAMKHFKSKLYAFVNSEILFTNALVVTLLKVIEHFPLKAPFLVTGARTDMFNTTMTEATSYKKLTAAALRRGHTVKWGEDYFITPPNYPWKDIPEFIIGRPYFDSWIVANAKARNIPTVDSTSTNLALHQSTTHDDIHRKTRPILRYNPKLAKKLNVYMITDIGHAYTTKYYTHFKNISLADIEVVRRHR